MTNNDIMITHAKRQGKLVSIKDVPSGKGCNCTCTKCGETLLAIKGMKNEQHFSG